MSPRNQLTFSAFRARHFYFLICSFIFFVCFSPTSRSATLRAAVAKVDITPPPGVAMWGYDNRKSPATGTLDPLFARVLVFEAGASRMAIVALDLGRTFGPDSLATLRAAAKNSNLLVAASHTHSGPVILDAYPGGPPAWESAALDKIARAIDEARGRLVEARLGAGYGVAYIGHNRLRVNPDGTVTWFERNLTQVPTAPVDPTVSVLRVDAADGKPLAILVNYSCHPVVFGADHLQYSADYPGVMTRTVEAAFGGKSGAGSHPDAGPNADPSSAGPLCFFLQGAPGDINPYYAVTPLAQDAVRMRDWTGERLGQEAARVAKEIRTQAEAQASLDFAEDLLKFRLRWDAEKWKKAMLAEFGPEAFRAYAPQLKTELELPVTTVLINKRIAIVGLPGEPFVDYQINWRDRCPVRDAFFFGYANGYSGYFPTIRAASLGGYGAGNSATWVEVGAGDRMVDHAIVRVYEMLGRLHDAPESGD